MKQASKNLIFLSLGLGILFFSSCQKDNASYESYFYLKNAPNETTLTLNVDGKSYGSILYAASPVTPSTTGTNHIQLAPGRHDITVYDVNGNRLIACYIDLHNNTVGTGSATSPAGGSELITDSKMNTFVGLWE
jgi:hypothetical protein